MSYHQVTVDRLSPTQISKLLNGHGVRVKHGGHHKIHLSHEQHKKFHRAHMKGSAATITFDPFQIHQHQHLRGHHMKGGDVFSDIGNAFSPSNMRNVGNQIAYELVDKGLPIAGSTLGGLAGAEGGPLGAMAGSYAGQQAGTAASNKIKQLYGMGFYEDAAHYGKKLAKAGAKHVITKYAPQVGRAGAEAFHSYTGIPVSGAMGEQLGALGAQHLNKFIGDGMYRHPFSQFGFGVKHRKAGRPRKTMRGRGNFWDDIQPATTYLRPTGDALQAKTIEKIQGLGLRKRKPSHKKQIYGKSLQAAGY